MHMYPTHRSGFNWSYHNLRYLSFVCVYVYVMKHLKGLHISGHKIFGQLLYALVTQLCYRFFFSIGEFCGGQTNTPPMRCSLRSSYCIRSCSSYPAILLPLSLPSFTTYPTFSSMCSNHPPTLTSIKLSSMDSTCK